MRQRGNHLRSWNELWAVSRIKFRARVVRKVCSSPQCNLRALFELHPTPYYTLLSLTKRSRTFWRFRPGWYWVLAFLTASSVSGPGLWAPVGTRSSYKKMCFLKIIGVSWQKEENERKLFWKHLTIFLMLSRLTSQSNSRLCPITTSCEGLIRQDADGGRIGPENDL